MRKKVLITGANGCIGNVLIKHLIKSSYKIFALALDDFDVNRINEFNNVNILYADICDPVRMREIFNKNRFNIVIHLAALVHKPNSSENEYMRVNFIATKDIINLSIKNGTKQFIFISSVAVHGEKGCTNSINEISKLKPETPYAKSKFQSELYLKNKSDNINYTIIRPATVYGRYDRGNINRLFKVVKRRVVPVIGNGRNFKSFVFVENLVQGVVKTINNPNAYNETFILSDEKPYTINCIVNDMARVIGKKVFVIHIPKRFISFFLKILNPIGYLIFKRDFFNISSIMKLTTNNIFNISKAKKVLAFQPKLSLFDGLKKIYLSEENEN